MIENYVNFEFYVSKFDQFDSIRYAKLPSYGEVSILQDLSIVSPFLLSSRRIVLSHVVDCCVYCRVCV